MSNKRFHGIGKFFLADLAIILSLVSCEVGLGPAVDVNPPDLSVTYPPSFSAVRGKFYVSGKASDDTSVKSVTVTLSRTSDFGKPITITKTANLEKDVWWVAFNEYDEEFNLETRTTTSTDPEKQTWAKYNGWKLPDGQYNVDVVAVDSVDRETKTSTPLSFSIDNTAPFFAIEKFITKGSDEKPVHYGQTLSIIGDLVDASGTDKIRFYAQEFDAPILLENRN